MSAKTYNFADTTQLSPHFNVQEFCCQCGDAHDTLVSDELINKLEKLRESLNCSKIIVTSGYRCTNHDAFVSTGKGQHTKGTAADVVCYGQDGQPISSKIVSCTSQDLNFGGIANIDSSYTVTHLDVRTGAKWYGDETKGTSTVTNDFYTYYGLSKRSDSEITAKGIDVSYAQGVIDWDKVKASGKVDFAILRAGYGKESSQVDDQFERNYSECKRLNIPCGAYWYSYATTANEAIQEATVCLETLAGKIFEYPVAFDIEEQRSLVNASELCLAFCSELEKAGYYTAIYSFKSALENNINTAVKAKYDVLLSHVNVAKSSYTGNYGLWQYSWVGKIEGVSGDVDLDYAYKKYPEIIKNAGLNGFSKPDFSPDSEEKPKKSTLEQILDHVASIDNKLS